MDKLKFRRSGIQARVLALTMFFTLGASLVIAASNMHQMTAEWERTTILNAEYALQTAASAIRRDVDEIDDLAGWGAYNPGMRTYLLTGDTASNQALSMYPTLTAKFNSMRTMAYIQRFLLINASGRQMMFGTAATSAVTLTPDILQRIPGYDSPNTGWDCILRDPLALNSQAANTIPVTHTLTLPGTDRTAHVCIFVSPSLILSPLRSFTLADDGQLYWEMGENLYTINGSLLSALNGSIADFDDAVPLDSNTLDPNTTGAYNDGLSDEVYSWLCNDLKYVDKDRTVMLCAHSSMFRKPDSEPADRDRHGPDYASRLAQYRCVHSWAGHSHINFNYAYSAEEPAPKFPNVESHILARSTGALWLNESMSSDGTPRGYMVVEVDGEAVSWYYKPYSYENDVPSGLDRSHQIRVYAPGAWYSDGYVYANVWNHDARWGAVRYTDSGKSGAEMKRVTVYDGAFVRMADYYNSVQTTATFEPFRTSHMFRILPTTGAAQATVETTDRFGEHYTTTLEW